MFKQLEPKKKIKSMISNFNKVYVVDSS